MAAKIYVGNLPKDLSEEEFKDLEDEIEREFSRYGKIAKIWVARRPPGFGEFRPRTLRRRCR